MSCGGSAVIESKATEVDLAVVAPKVNSIRQHDVALRYHVLLLFVMVRYGGKIMHKDRSELAATCVHSPITVLVSGRHYECHVIVDLS